MTKLNNRFEDEDYDFIVKGESPDYSLAIIFAWTVIILTVLLSCETEASVMSCDSVDEMNESQVTVLLKSYERGLESDLGYTLAAIAWKESSAGKYRVNPLSSDYGAYGINYKTVQRITGFSYYESIGVIQDIIFNDDEGATFALETLEWNMKHHKGDWRKAVMHYNAGNQYWLGKEYASEISTKVKILQTCLPM